jgi:hypothetical protein
MCGRYPGGVAAIDLTVVNRGAIFPQKWRGKIPPPVWAPFQALIPGLGKDIKYDEATSTDLAILAALAVPVGAANWSFSWAGI